MGLALMALVGLGLVLATMGGGALSVEKGKRYRFTGQLKPKPPPQFLPNVKLALEQSVFASDIRIKEEPERVLVQYTTIAPATLDVQKDTTLAGLAFEILEVEEI